MTQQTLFTSIESPNPVFERWKFPDAKKAIEFAQRLCYDGKYAGIQILPIESGKPERIVKAVKL